MQIVNVWNMRYHYIFVLIPIIHLEYIVQLKWKLSGFGQLDKRSDSTYKFKFKMMYFRYSVKSLINIVLLMQIVHTQNTILLYLTPLQNYRPRPVNNLVNRSFCGGYLSIYFNIWSVSPHPDWYMAVIQTTQSFRMSPVARVTVLHNARQEQRGCTAPGPMRALFVSHVMSDHQISFITSSTGRLDVTSGPRGPQSFLSAGIERDFIGKTGTNGSIWGKKIK